MLAKIFSLLKSNKDFYSQNNLYLEFSVVE